MASISIPQPCSEKWADMRPTASDCRFCAACERQITDFTAKTDAEILDYLKQRNGKICGRFRADQLGRALAPPRAFRFKGLNLIASLATWLAIQPAAKTQTTAPFFAEPGSSIRSLGIELIAPKNSLRIISGIVTDAEDEMVHLANASVQVKGKFWRALTNAEGVFLLIIPEEVTENEPITLLVSCPGYTSQEMKMPKTDELRDFPLLPARLPKLVSKQNPLPPPIRWRSEGVVIGIFIPENIITIDRRFLPARWRDFNDFDD